MRCDYCHLEAAKLYRVEDEHICRTCLGDVEYCRMGGHIPQEVNEDSRAEPR